MEQDAVYGGDHEISAFKSLYGIKVAIYNSSLNMVYDIGAFSKHDDSCLKLCYTGNHYDVLIIPSFTNTNDSRFHETSTSPASFFDTGRTFCIADDRSGNDSSSYLTTFSDNVHNDLTTTPAATYSSVEKTLKHPSSSFPFLTPTRKPFVQLDSVNDSDDDSDDDFDDDSGEVWIEFKK